MLHHCLLYLLTFQLDRLERMCPDRTQNRNHALRNKPSSQAWPINMDLYSHARQPQGTRYLEIFQSLELVIHNPIQALYIQKTEHQQSTLCFDTEQIFKHRLSGSESHSRLVRDEGCRHKRYPRSTLRDIKRAIRDSKYWNPWDIQ